MPRIDAPTVAEHRQHRRRALLDAATAILVADGLAATTPAAVGAAAGLARSSVYEYFDSSAAIVAAIVEDAFPRTNAELADAVAGAGDPASDRRLRPHLAEAVRRRRVPAGSGAAASEVPRECLARLDELFELQADPLLRAMRDAKVPDAALSCALVRGCCARRWTRSTQGPRPARSPAAPASSCTRP